MRKRYLYLTIIWACVLVLGGLFLFLKKRAAVAQRNELKAMEMVVMSDPLLEKLVQSAEATPETSGSLDVKGSETTIDSTSTTDYALTPDQKRRAEELTSLFENGTTKIAYDYAERLDDGRGITAGRAGFTTSDGDAYMVVKVYAKLNPGNKLQKYVDTLKKLAENGSDSTKGLSGYEKAWKDSAKDSKFRDAQDYVVDKLYFQPSQKYADELGLKTAIARAFMYDTIIQHGDGDDKDSLKALITSTNSKLGGSPKDGVDEFVWFKEFMSVRKSDLAKANDESTRDEWAKSVGRVDVYKQIFDSENYDLKGPIKIKTKEYDTTIL